MLRKGIDKATQTAAKINTAGDGDRALAVVGDILDDGYIETLVQRAAEFGDGKIHIIVNNAGFTWDGVIHKVSFIPFSLLCFSFWGGRGRRGEG